MTDPLLGPSRDGAVDEYGFVREMTTAQERWHQTLMRGWVDQTEIDTLAELSAQSMVYGGRVDAHRIAWTRFSASRSLKGDGNIGNGVLEAISGSRQLKMGRGRDHEPQRLTDTVRTMNRDQVQVERPAA